MIDGSAPLLFTEEVLEGEETLATANAKVRTTVDELVSQWDSPPSPEMRCALLVLVLYIEADHAWCGTDDIVSTRIIDLVFADSLRAHSDGVVQYQSGEFAYIEEFTYPVVRKLREILGLAAKVFEFGVQSLVGRDLATAFELLAQEHTGFDAKKATCHATFAKRRNDEDIAWLKEGGRVIMDISDRFAMKGKGAESLDSYGSYFPQPKPDPVDAYVNFKNATFKICRTGDAGGRFTKVAKSPENNCYFGIPVSLGYKPSHAHEQELRLFLCTSFAGNPEGRRMDLASEAFVYYNLPSPQVALLFTGDGGNSKSAKAVLRANCFGSHHHFVSSGVLQVPEEFRKQGKHHARARIATVQENKGGEPWSEDIVKRWFSGVFIACRALFGKSTELYSWLFCRIYLEWNRAYPSIRGDWRNMQSLRAFWRRLAVIELGAVFTSDLTKVRIADRVFEEKDLAAFLSGGDARLIYIRNHLIPFIQKHTADECREMLKNPSPTIVEATKRVVAQMANGGLVLPDEWESPERREARVQDSKDMLMKVHASFGENQTARIYEVVKMKGSPIPGTVTGIRSGGVSRRVNFEKAAGFYPFLFRIHGNLVTKLDLDLPRLATLIEEYGREALGCGLEEWGVLWDLQEQLDEFTDHPTEGLDEDIIAPTDTAAGSLAETVNIRALEEEIRNKDGEKVNYARSYIRRHTRHGVSQAGKSTVVIEYYRKHQIAGRRYAQGPSLQGLSKSLRKTALSASDPLEAEELFEIDGVNFFITILWNELRDVVGDAVDIGYQTFTALVKNPVTLRRFVASTLDISAKEAKKLLIKILHWGRPSHPLPLLWALAVQMRAAAEIVLQKSKFDHLASMFSDRRLPSATRLHYALSSIEDSLVEEVTTALVEEFGGELQVTVLIFDGLIVKVQVTSHAARVRRILDKVGAAAHVAFTVEQL